FFKKNSADTEYSEIPPKIIEKAATIKSKSRFDKTSDLEEIPTILAVEELDKTRIMLSADQRNSNENVADEYDSSDQIKMDGFDDETDDVPEIDEETAEELLRVRREDKVNKFRLFAKEEVEGDKRSEAKKIKIDDYKDKSESKETLNLLVKRKISVKIQIALTVVFGIVLLALTLLQGYNNLPPFLSSTRSYYITVMIVYAVILLVNINVIFHGLDFRKGINYDFPIAVAALLAMGHTAAMFFNPDISADGGMLYPSAAVFALFMSGAGKNIMLSRIIKNFKFLIEKEEKSTVEEIVNEVDAAVISRNMLDDPPYLKYSVKTDFPTSFLEISFADEPADRIAKALSPVLIALNLALFAAVGFVSSNWNFAFNILTGSIMLSCPAVTLAASNSALSSVSKALERRGAMVCGFEGAKYVHNSNALVMEAFDLFGKRSCEMHGIKTFNGAKIDDAILQTAAVIIKTKSPLARVFDDVIIGKQSILPEAEGIIYEDKMGTSAWIYQKKILVGTRELLIRHGVAVPKQEYENKYTKKGRKALYLSVAGKVCAMFIVSYSADEDLKKSLKRLEKSGITIILRSCDPFINEKSISEIFDLPEGFIRVMTSSNGRCFEKYSEAVVEKSPAYAVHRGKTISFISSVLGADNIVGTEKIISVLVSFGCAIGFGVAALLGFLNGISQLTALNIIIFQAIWSLFVMIITKLRKNGI
ncbi:MAG: hypothetical protein LUG21_02145, partial [Clostridiales bacterium]|nr:hypothetical protein [Clostridiales bacterium]